ncbi:MAG: tetratricopeptide repeat protein, partial [Bacteroidales bacterium]|nr:tetratricopeptide repeat protein [Bacteroidales bacterium]
MFFLIVFTLTLWGQKTAIYRNPEVSYKTGIELLEKEKYGAAQDHFDFVIREVKNPLSHLRVNAEYFDALCALELFNKDAEFKFNEFIRKHPTNSRVSLINYQLGRLAYRNKKYSSAQKYFAEVDESELSEDQLAEYNFKIGYCYFKTKDLQDAKPYFEKVRYKDSKYNSPASYYLAHIAYIEEDYTTALAEFEELAKDPNFSAVVPYYLVQILFVQEKYDEVLEVAPELFENATAKRKPEIARIIGESNYRLDNFEKALPFMEQYHQTSRSRISREDNYSYAFTLYKTGNYEKAITYFQKITGSKDELAQYTYYYLAACYLETGQKKFAANAFNSAYKLPFDQEIREDALFNHAQLAFELSFDPYSEAINALKKYLQNYPDSERNDDAYNFLFKISMATRNFDDAQEALEHIKTKGKDYNKNYQLITFYRGIELFNQFNYEEANNMFLKVIDNDFDKSITTQAKFWTGESFYRMENYWGAKKYYMEFLSASAVKKLPIYNIANYNLGYVYFKRKEYSGAIYNFKEFISKLKDENPAMVADAFLRMGDSWFITKGYDNAIEYYDKAIAVNAIDVDYALFQKAVALGVLQRYNEKIQTLKSIISNYPNSSSISEVIYELGDTYLVTHDNENALINFRKVASDHSGSRYSVKARLKTGLIYYNNNQSELALSTFKKIVADFPNTSESKEALASIKNIYVETNEVDEYLAYVNNLPFAEVRISEQDSITYVAAENKYMDGDYEAARPFLENYVEKFEDGAFILSARFYLAECQLVGEEFEKALENYEFVLNKPKSEFTESALLKAATISNNLENYENALNYFTKLEKTAENKTNVLEAQYGIMKCYYLLDNYEEALSVIGKVLAVEKISDEKKLDALVIKANSLYRTDDLLLAKSAYKKIVEFSQGEAGAEAKYRIAEIEFMISDNESAEKTLFELINQYASHDYWVAKGFILLANIYIETDNIFQAKQT